MNFWIGTSDDFDNPAYWTDGVPTPDDIITFNGTPGPISTTIDGDGSPTSPPPSGPQPYSLSNLTFPEVGDENYEPAYAGIRIINGYSGVVTFPANVDFGEYKQTTGSTAQETGTALTITSSFLWTGGAVNATGNVATYNIIGATGQIGGDTTDLSSGSKFVTISGAEVIQAGILNILNDQGIDVLEGSIFRQQQLINQVNNKPQINLVHEVLVRGQLYSDGGKLASVKVDGGHLYVEEHGLEVAGKVPGTDWSVTVTTTGSGIVSIYNGGTLKVAHGLKFNNANGALVTLYSPDVAQTATIEGKFRFLAGEINLGEHNNTPASYFSSLVVTENAELWGGVFKPKLSPVTSTLNDFIKTEKKLDIGSVFTVTPENSDPQTPPYVSAAWSVLQSQFGFKDHINPTNGKPLVYSMDRSQFEELPDGQFVELNWVVKPKP